MFGKRMSRWLVFLTIAFVALFAAACSTDGNNDNGTDETAEYTVTYTAGAEEATGQAPPTKVYRGGVEFTLPENTFSYTGNVFAGWNDGKETFAAGDTYKMPAADVTFKAVWQPEKGEGNLDEATKVEAVRESSLTVETNEGGRTVKAGWFAEYTADALKVTAETADTVVMSTGALPYNDGIELRVAKCFRGAGYADPTLQIAADVAGNLKVVELYSGNAVTDSGVTVTAELLTIDGKTVAGWRITVSVPYSYSDISATDKDATVAVALNSASNAADAHLLYSDAFGSVPEQAHTYIHVKGDGTFEKNPNAEMKSAWGTAGDFTAADGWNTAYDDGTENSYIRLDRVDGEDHNYIYLVSDEDSGNYADGSWYAQVDLHADKTLLGGNNGAKFGVMLASESGEQLLIYVDAAAESGTIKSESKAFGYTRTSDWGGWKNPFGDVGDNSDVYTGEGNYVRLGIVYNGCAASLTLNGQVMGDPVFTNFGNDKVYFGLFSFSVRVTAKGWSVETEEGNFPSVHSLGLEAKGMSGGAHTIDGDFSDWSGKEFQEGKSWTSPHVKWMTDYTDEGLHLAYRLTAPDGKGLYMGDAADTITELVNIEFQNATAPMSKLCISGGKLYYTGYITAAAMKLTGTGQNVTQIDIEIFVRTEDLSHIAYDVQTDSLRINSGGYLNVYDADGKKEWVNAAWFYLYNDGDDTQFNLIKKYGADEGDEEPEGKNAWGNGGNLPAADGWDTTHDDGTDNAYISLESFPDDHNYIYLISDTKSGNYADGSWYAQVELHADKALPQATGDPRFGVMLASVSGKRILIYVNAEAESDTIKTDSTAFGYVRTSDWGGWKNPFGNVGATSEVYTGEESYVRLGIVYNGCAASLTLNGQVMGDPVFTDFGSEKVYFGLYASRVKVTAKGWSVEKDDSRFPDAHYLGTEASGQNGGSAHVIDGDFGDWSDKTPQNGKDWTSPHVKWMTDYTDEGLYLAYRLTALEGKGLYMGDVADTTAELVNIEFQNPTEGAHELMSKLCISGGKLCYTGYITAAAMKLAGTGQNVTQIDIEIFVRTEDLSHIAYDVQTDSLRINSGGYLNVYNNEGKKEWVNANWWYLYNDSGDDQFNLIKKSGM